MQSAVDEAEAERLRRIRRWPRGVALWKLALRKLAEERPTLWRVAERHAGAPARPPNLDRVVAWYRALEDATPRGVVEMRRPPPAVAAAAGANGGGRGGGAAGRGGRVARARRARARCARGAVASEVSPMMAALLSPRNVTPASYPKAAAIDVGRLPYGVWSADFSRERGPGGGAGGGAAAVDARAPGSVGEHEYNLLVARRPPSHDVAGLRVQVGTVAPANQRAKDAASARGSNGGGASASALSHRAAPVLSRPSAAAARTRELARESAGLPFGMRYPTYLDQDLSATVPPTRYNPLFPNQRKPRDTDFGAGGVLKRVTASNATATGEALGPGTYTPRPELLAVHSPRVRIQGRPNAHSRREPTPAPGDHTHEAPRSARGAYSFNRGRTGREQPGVAAAAKAAPAQGLVAWTALEPALVRAGLMERTAHAETGTLGAKERAKGGGAAAAVDGAAPLHGRTKAVGDRQDAGERGPSKDDYLRQLAKELRRDPPAW